MANAFWSENKKEREEEEAKFLTGYAMKFYKENSFDFKMPETNLEKTEKQQKIVETPEIRRMVYEITKNDKKIIEKVYHIQQYVYKNISYKEIPGASYSYITLQNKEGDCLDKAILLSSMLNIIDVENYIVETIPENYVNHAFVIAKIYGKYLKLETTSSFFTTNNHTFYEIYNKNKRIKL